MFIALVEMNTFLLNRPVESPFIPSTLACFQRYTQLKLLVLMYHTKCHIECQFLRNIEKKKPTSPHLC